MEPPDPSKPYFLSQTRQNMFWILGSENGVPSRLAPTSHAIRPTWSTWRCLFLFSWLPFPTSSTSPSPKPINYDGAPDHDPPNPFILLSYPYLKITKIRPCLSKSVYMPFEGWILATGWLVSKMIWIAFVLRQLVWSSSHELYDGS